MKIRNVNSAKFDHFLVISRKVIHVLKFCFLSLQVLLGLCLLVFALGVSINAI